MCIRDSIAINLTMQRRGLPVAYVVTAGNQAQTGLAAIGEALLQDPRVTALGLHIEGIDDVAALEALAANARDLGKPIVALKVGASSHAQTATVSHTASLAGSDAGASALLKRLGIGRVTSLSALLETLKLLHTLGPLASNKIASVSCSGGEASLMADSALAHDLEFPPLTAIQTRDLRDALGVHVALANPLDYHTFIWGDFDAMVAAFSGMMDPDLALGVIVLDFPRADRCDASDWDMVIDVVAAARDARGVPMALLASLPDTMPEQAAQAIMDRGLVPLAGLTEALEAISVAAMLGNLPGPTSPVLQAMPVTGVTIVPESEAKVALAQFGLTLPERRHVSTVADAIEAADDIGYPVVLKGEGAAHKTEAGLVRLNIACTDDLEAAFDAMPADGHLVEAMVPGGVAELLIGVTADPAHGFVLTLGAGGTLTELWKDSVSLMLPATQAEIVSALQSLRIAPLLSGYRGATGVDQEALVDAVLAVQNYVVANGSRVVEVEVNPLICTTENAIAADALIRLGDPST